MNRLRLEARLSNRRAHQVTRHGQVKVNQFPALSAERMVVTLCLTVVAARAVAEADLIDQSGIFQIFQRIIDGRVADRRQTAARSLVNLAGRQMIFALADHLKDSFTLLRKRPRASLISVT